MDLNRRNSNIPIKTNTTASHNLNTKRNSCNNMSEYHLIKNNSINMGSSNNIPKISFNNFNHLNTSKLSVISNPSTKAHDFMNKFADLNSHIISETYLKLASMMKHLTDIHNVLLVN